MYFRNNSRGHLEQWSRRVWTNDHRDPTHCLPGPKPNIRPRHSLLVSPSCKYTSYFTCTFYFLTLESVIAPLFQGESPEDWCGPITPSRESLHMNVRVKSLSKVRTLQK